VVEGARLESVYGGNSIAGSNPAPSAKPTRFEGRGVAVEVELFVCGWIAPAVRLLIHSRTDNKTRGRCVRSSWENGSAVPRDNRESP
jgi:hypothetical protein